MKESQANAKAVELPQNVISEHRNTCASVGNEKTAKVASGTSQRKRKIPTVDVPSIKTKGDDPSPNDSEKKVVRLTKRGACTNGTKTVKTETSGDAIQLDDLFEGLCSLCGEMYLAEFFVCKRCNNCVHIGCSPQESIVDEICYDCMN